MVDLIATPHSACLRRPQGGFDRSLANLRVERLGSGTVTCVLPVTADVANSYGTLHGGATSTLVDVVGTMALLTQDPLRPGVSVELSVSFLAAAKLGEEVAIEGRVLRQGKKLGFTQVDLRRKSDGTLLATGRHTKAL
jgi:acyl-coenzyme A thioesterase 13